MVAGSIGRGLEPVQASPTAFSAMVFSFSWNSDSMMPKSFSVLGMPMAVVHGADLGAEAFDQLSRGIAGHAHGAGDVGIALRNGRLSLAL